jgi:hypothetical protein
MAAQSTTGEASRPSFLLSPVHRWLLAAALGSDAAMRDGWRQWAAATDFDHLDGRSYPLLPLLAQNAQTHAIDAPIMGRLRGILRKNWYRNQLRLQQLGATLQLLHDAGAQPALHRSSALAVSAYPSIGLRTLTTNELLFRPEEATHVIHTLSAHGWHASAGESWPAIQRRLASQPAVGMEKDELSGLTLWFALSPETLTATADPALWGRMVPVSLETATALVPSPADLLLASCTAGIGAPATAPLDWIADSVVLLRSGEHVVDWPLLVSEARRLQVSRLLAPALAYLAAEFHAPVPPDVLPQLFALPAAPWEEAEAADRLHAWRWAGRRSRYWHPFRRLRQTAPAWRTAPLPLAYGDFLQQRLHVDGYGALANRLWQRARRPAGRA